MTDADEQAIAGSGNVFADLGLEDADELLVQAELVHLVHSELRRRRLKPERLPDCSASRRMKPSRLSADALSTCRLSDCCIS